MHCITPSPKSQPHFWPAPPPTFLILPLGRTLRTRNERARKVGLRKTFRTFWVKPKTARRRGPAEQTGQRANHFLPEGVCCSGLRGAFPDGQERPRTPGFQTQTRLTRRPALSPRSRPPGRQAAPSPVPCGDALSLDAPAGGRDISTQSGAHAPAAAAFFPPSPRPELRVKPSTRTLSLSEHGRTAPWVKESEQQRTFPTPRTIFLPPPP